MKFINQLKWIGAAALLAACAGEPTAPTVPATTEQRSWNDHDDRNYFDFENFGREPDLRFIASFKVKPGPPDPLNEHKMIGAAGGSLRVGDFEIIVPPGAVDRPTNFGIRVPTDPREVMKAFAEFTPHMYFKRPVTIRLPAASTTVNNPYVLWWTGFFWLPLDTDNTRDGRIEAETWHFSIYGTSYWSKGITLLGG